MIADTDSVLVLFSLAAAEETISLSPPYPGSCSVDIESPSSVGQG